MKTYIHRIFLLLTVTLFGSMGSMLYGDIYEYGVNNYQITCSCYPSNFATTYTAVDFDTHLHVSGDRYDFLFVELTGDLEIYQFDEYIDPNYWDHDAWGYYPSSPINFIKYMKLSFTVLKNDIEPGANRNFKLKWRKRAEGEGQWGDWDESDEFTVSVSDITVSGTTGTLCNSSQSYSISAPTGYSTTWSFTPTNYVTSSSGSGTTAALTGSCNDIGDGLLTFTMTKASCPTFTATRAIRVNGPDHTDLGMSAYYTNGNPVPKGGSTYLLCANTHYHI